jgi:hypothetical protein
MAGFKATIVAMNKFMKLLKQPNLGPDVWINPSLVASAYEANPQSNPQPEDKMALRSEVKLVPPSLRPPLVASIVLATFEEFGTETEKHRLGRIQVNSGMVAALSSKDDSLPTAIYLIDDTTSTLNKVTPYKVNETIPVVAKKLGIELEVSTKA